MPVKGRLDVGAARNWVSRVVKKPFNRGRVACSMQDTYGDLAPRQLDGATGERRWSHICDSSLAFVTPQLQRLAQLWDVKRAARPLPCQSDFSLRDLSFALPNIALVELVRASGRLRFRVRLMGSALDTYVGPLTGKFIDEAMPAYLAEKWTSIWLGALDAQGVCRSAGKVEVAGRNHYVFEKFCAPLAPDAGVSREVVLVATYFHGLDKGEIAAQLTSEIADRQAV